MDAYRRPLALGEQVTIGPSGPLVTVAYRSYSDRYYLYLFPGDDVPEGPFHPDELVLVESAPPVKS